MEQNKAGAGGATTITPQQVSELFKQDIQELEGYLGQLKHGNGADYAQLWQHIRMKVNQVCDRLPTLSGGTTFAPSE